MSIVTSTMLSTGLRRTNAAIRIGTAPACTFLFSAAFSTSSIAGAAGTAVGVAGDVAATGSGATGAAATVNRLARAVKPGRLTDATTSKTSPGFAPAGNSTPRRYTAELATSTRSKKGSGVPTTR